MHRRRAVVLLPLLLALACSPGGENGAAPQPAPGVENEGQGDSGGEDGSGGNATSEEPDPAGDEKTVTAQPSAELKGKCSTAPKNVDGVDQLVAELEVVNTGNLGVRVYVTSRWPTAPTGGVTRGRRVLVDQGATRPITLGLGVDETTAESVRRAVSRGRACAIHSRVVGAYGVPEEDS